MNKNVLAILLVLVVILPGYSKKSETKIYKEVILEDFEKTAYTKKHLQYQVKDNTNYEPDVKVRDQFPAPTGKSKKYIGIKFFAKYGENVTIVPPKPLQIFKYCRQIFMWVYGKNFAGQLSILIQDVDGRSKRIILGKLNFLGWRKLKVRIGRRVKQQEDLLNKKKFIQIKKIQYRAANRTFRPIWHYFYIDDISASVREKYTDKQSDDW